TNPAVDADHLAGHVEERAAGVAADEGAVGLDDGVAPEPDAADADDRASTFLVPARVSGGDHPLARLQVLGRPDLDVGPLAPAGDLDHAAIDRGAEAEGFPLDRLAVVEDDLDLLAGFAGHVTRGQDEPVLRHDHATPGGLADAQADRGRDDLVQNGPGLLLKGLQVVNRLRGGLGDGGGGFGNGLRSRVGGGQAGPQQGPEQGERTAETHGDGPLLADKGVRLAGEGGYSRYDGTRYGFQPAGDGRVSRNRFGRRVLGGGAAPPGGGGGGVGQLRQARGFIPIVACRTTG